MERIVLFHFSDLHIGSHHLGSTAWHNGLFGHHFALIQRLIADVQSAHDADLHVNDSDVVEYAVGGDLTRVGSDSDFHLAHTYLLGKLNWIQDRGAKWFRNGQGIGLEIEPTSLHTIPGNHDHWNGHEMLPGYRFRRPPAYNQFVFPHFLETTPWRHSVPSRQGNMVLELFGVDSNEGLRQKSTNLRAAGALSDEELYGVHDANGHIVTKGLEQLLNDAHHDAGVDGKSRIAAIMCHHPFTSRNGLPDARPLDDDSSRKLLELARAHGVRAILTGHTHYFLNEKKEIPGEPRVWELRCGTTLQLASQMQFPLPRFGQLLAPGFWVHEIMSTDKQGWDSLAWRAWKYQWDGSIFARNPKPVIVD